MTMTFKEALIAHLQGEKVEARVAQRGMPWKDFMTHHGQGYIAQINDPDFAGACEYRIAPPTILVNGVEVPAPQVEAPEKYDCYYVPDTAEEDLYYELTWSGDEMDHRYLERGLLYRDEESAIARAKAMLITQEVK